MANARLTGLLTTIGQVGVNALFPNDFEYYLLTLELVDSNDRTVDYLAFPVSPESMSYDDTKLVNIKKSMSGITALDNETFTPKTIAIEGTFGRKLRVLLGNKPIFPKNIGKSFKQGGVFGGLKATGLQIKKFAFDLRLKTGFGTTKVLESMILRASSLDSSGKPHKLYLYNPAIGHNFLVKTKMFQMRQDRQSSNMLWRYNVQFVAIANLDDVRPSQGKVGKLVAGLGMGLLQKGANKLMNSVKQSVF